MKTIRVVGLVIAIASALLTPISVQSQSGSISEREMNGIQDAVKRCDFEKIPSLICDHPEKINDPIWRLLHWAATCGNRDIAELLIAHGANVNAKDYSGDPALEFAVSVNDLESRAKHLNKIEIATLLIKHGADVNATSHVGATPLHMAALCGSVQMVKLLVENGATVNAQDNFDRTPLHNAIKTMEGGGSGSIEAREVVAYLKQKGGKDLGEKGIGVSWQ